MSVRLVRKNQQIELEFEKTAKSFTQLEWNLGLNLQKHSFRYLLSAKI